MLMVGFDKFDVESVGQEEFDFIECGLLNRVRFACAQKNAFDACNNFINDEATKQAAKKLVIEEINYVRWLVRHVDTADMNEQRKQMEAIMDGKVAPVVKAKERNQAEERVIHDLTNLPC